MNPQHAPANLTGDLLRENWCSALVLQISVSQKEIRIRFGMTNSTHIHILRLNHPPHTTPILTFNKDNVPLII